MRGDHKKNIAKANEYAREEALKGNCAIAPHCVFTQFLNDEVPEERSLGQEMGKELLCSPAMFVNSIFISFLFTKNEHQNKSLKAYFLILLLCSSYYRFIFFIIS